MPSRAISTTTRRCRMPSGRSLLSRASLVSSGGSRRRPSGMRLTPDFTSFSTRSQKLLQVRLTITFCSPRRPPKMRRLGADRGLSCGVLDRQTPVDKTRSGHPANGDTQCVGSGSSDVRNSLYSTSRLHQGTPRFGRAEKAQLTDYLFLSRSA